MRNCFVQQDQHNQEFCGMKLKQILIIGCEQLVGSLWKNGLAIVFIKNEENCI